LTSTQCREARRLLGWNQKRLAVAAGVYAGCLVEFERHGRFPTTKSGQDRLGIVRGVFETAGVLFVDENGGGPGVQLRKAEP